MSRNPQIIRLETDLLILGTGAAGCGAALAAREAGVKTLMVDKGKLESSGCLGGGNDHLWPCSAPTSRKTPSTIW